jgi:hypothetical protein
MYKVWSSMLVLRVLGALYFACLPQAGTLYNEVLLLVSRLLLLTLLGTLYFVLYTIITNSPNNQLDSSKTFFSNLDGPHPPAKNRG